MFDIRYEHFIEKNTYQVKLYSVETNDKICECKISVNPESRSWTISSWFTVEKYQHLGFGTKTLENCLDLICQNEIELETVEYIWNGANEYVLDWLNENFGAVSRCPIAVQKYSSDDDWNAHIYVLNKQKFVNYFNLEFN